MIRTTPIAMLATLACVAVSGCDPSSGHDREAVREEMRKLDEQFRSYAPKIQLRDAVGCNVCPGLCQDVDLSEPFTMPELLARYRQVVLAAPNAVETRDELERLSCITARRGVPGELAFLVLLDDEAEAVRFHAAIDALSTAFAVQRPIEVLTEIANTSTAPYAYLAGARVKIYYEVDLEDRSYTPALRKERLRRPHVR